MTVSCRRSASPAGAGAARGSARSGSPRRAAIADSSRRRCPTEATPSATRSSAVSSGRSAPSMSLSAKAGAYCSRPIPRSHWAMSTAMPASIPRRRGQAQHNSRSFRSEGNLSRAILLAKIRSPKRPVRVDLSRRMEFGRITVFSALRPLLVSARTAATQSFAARRNNAPWRPVYGISRC